MIIKPIGGGNGKYYGTELVEDRGAMAGLSLRLWHNTGNPSDRQLAAWGLTRQQWDSNAEVDDGWGGKCGVRDSDYLCDGHYESQETYEFAARICDMANAPREGRRSRTLDGVVGSLDSET